MKHQYAVFHRSSNLPHRGPFDTFEEAQDWVDEAVEDGFKQGVFFVLRREVGEWTDLE